MKAAYRRVALEPSESDEVIERTIACALCVVPVVVSLISVWNRGPQAAFAGAAMGIVVALLPGILSCASTELLPANASSDAPVPVETADRHRHGRREGSS